MKNLVSFKTIKQFGPFQNFDWKTVKAKDGQMLHFQPLNFIFGRNYSGKTTLSKILQAFETKTLPEHFDSVTFELGFEGGTVPMPKRRFGQMNERKKPNPRLLTDKSSDDNLSEKIVAKLIKHQLPAILVDVAPSADKGLRTALKDLGGRPKKTNGGTKIMTQAEMAVAFGAPCNESMVANWEARAAGKKRGANPPDAIYNGERIIYSAKLRTNPTPDNTKRLSALIAEFQSRHRIKEAIGEKARHMKSAETLAKASGQVGAAIREQSQLKYEK